MEIAGVRKLTVNEITYRGRRLTELSREELMEACRFMYISQEEERESHRHETEVWKSLRGARKEIFGG